eukprot:1164829-Rhodomonas_salina.2
MNCCLRPSASTWTAYRERVPVHELQLSLLDRVRPDIIPPLPPPRASISARKPILPPEDLVPAYARHQYQVLHHPTPDVSTRLGTAGRQY